MTTKLIHAVLIGSSLAGTLLIYFLIANLSERFFTVPAGLLLLAVGAVYAYGAATFMTIRGIHPFSKTGRIR